MPSYILPIAIVLPILGGALVPFLPFKKKSTMHIYVETIVVLTSILVFCILFQPPTETMNLIHFFGDLSISFKLDGLGSVFTAMVAIASFVAILGFCIGCFIRFQWQQYRYKKSVNKTV